MIKKGISTTILRKSVELFNSHHLDVCRSSFRISLDISQIFSVHVQTFSVNLTAEGAIFKVKTHDVCVCEREMNDIKRKFNLLLHLYVCVLCISLSFHSDVDITMSANLLLRNIC